MTPKEQQRSEMWEQTINANALHHLIFEKTVEGAGVTKGIDVWHGNQHPAGVTVRAISHDDGLIAQVHRVGDGRDPAAVPATPLIVEADGGEVDHGSQPWHAYTVTCQCQARLNPIAALDLLQEWVQAEQRRSAGKTPRIVLE